MNKRGITLISLIITVIILLILMGISMDLIINKKIFSSAQEVVNKSEKQMDTHQEVTEEARNTIKPPDIPTGSIITFMVGSAVFFTKRGMRKIKFPLQQPTGVAQVFDGWYYDAECTQEAKEGDNITQDITLYAKCAINGAIDDDLYLSRYPAVGEYTEEKLLEWADQNNKLGFGLDNTDGGSYYDVLVYVPYVLLAEEKGYQINSTIKSYELLNASDMPETVYTIPHSSGSEVSAQTSVVVQENGLIRISPWSVSGWSDTVFKVKVTWDDGMTVTYRIVGNYFYCLAEGTMITLADKSRKAIEDIEYTDNLLVWDFDNGCFAEAKPLWIKKVQKAEEYNHIIFEDGTELNTVADHRVFNMELQKFTYTMNEEDTPIGTKVFKEDGTVTKLIGREVVKKEVEYYNIITDYHMNLFANGILTSLRLNNLYKIENMKFVKDNRELVDKSEFEGIPENYFYGLRLAEQPKEINKGNDVKHTKTLKEYVERILKLAK